MNFITPGQGLLLLLSHYRHEPEKLTELKKLYLSGASDTDSCILLCDYLLNEPLLADYDLAINEKSINEDPTRRYFETHLAYETIKHQIKHINYDELRRLYTNSARLVDQKISSCKRQTINEVFKGECESPSFKHDINWQFSTYIKKLKTNRIFSELSAYDREKIKWVSRVTYMALVNGWRHTKLPLDIYFNPIYHDRGAIRYDDTQKTTRSQNAGILKGHMPLAYEDNARALDIYPYCKASESSTFCTDSADVQACFQQLVHPFINGISGVFLVQLRVLAHLISQDTECIFTSKLSEFKRLCQIIIASLLYEAGGHSFYEYVAVLLLPETQTAFGSIPDFSSLNLTTLFYTDNEEAFDTALTKTIEYNHMILKRKIMHEELLKCGETFFNTSSKKYQKSSSATVTNYQMR